MWGMKNTYTMLVEICISATVLVFKSTGKTKVKLNSNLDEMSVFLLLQNRSLKAKQHFVLTGHRIIKGVHYNYRSKQIYKSRKQEQHCAILICPAGH